MYSIHEDYGRQGTMMRVDLKMKVPKNFTAVEFLIP